MRTFFQLHKIFIVILSVALCLICFLSCYRHSTREMHITENTDTVSIVTFDSVRAMLADGRMNTDRNMVFLEYSSEKGQFKEVTEIEPRVFRLAEKTEDTALMTSSGLYLAQAWLFLDKPDSAAMYLNKIAPILEHDTLSNLTSTYHNIQAIYKTKAETEYNEAIRHLRISYRMAEKNRDRHKMLTALSNMTAIYLARQDTSGIKYAYSAYKMAVSLNNSYAILYSVMNLADMLLLQGNYMDARSYGHEALDIIREEKRQGQMSRAYVIIADSYFIENNLDSAALYLDSARIHIASAESGCDARFYVNSGRLEMVRGDYARATLLLKTAMNRPDCLPWLKVSVYHLLYETYLAKGDEANALSAYIRYNEMSDSLLLQEKEVEAHRLHAELEKANYERLLSESRLALAQSRQVVQISVAVSLLVVVAFIALLSIYKNRSRFYKNMMEQYNRQTQQQERIQKVMLSEPEEPEDGQLRELFRKISDRMDEGKLYKNKDISLELLSEEVASNRVYVSRAINRYAGDNFFNYVNKLRIKEAAGIISESDTPLKEVSEKVGFGTLSSFYKAFQKETGFSPAKYRTYHKMRV